MMPRVFVQATDFGFGPAAVLLALIEPLANELEFCFISSGNALRLIRQTVPGATTYEVECNFARNWSAILSIAPPRSIIITASPGFAAWSAEKGYRVGLINPLDWMSGERLTVPPLAFHLVPAYYGPNPDGAREEGASLIRPVVASCFLGELPEGPAPYACLIAFGGMAAIGGREDLANRYASWLLGSTLPVIVDELGIIPVAIVGGNACLPALAGKHWHPHPGVRLIPALGTAVYARLLRTTPHIIVTPGLSTIYECHAAGLSPFLQPGYNKSMVLQLHDLVELGYPHVAMWPWAGENIESIRQMPQPEALKFISSLIERAIEEDGFSTALLQTSIRGYAADVDRAQLPLGHLFEAPDGSGLLRRELARLTGSPA